MIKLLDILIEGKQVGFLYHWTDFMGSMNIISQDFLKGYLTDTFKIQPAISFTRDKNFYKGKNKLSTKPEICFVVDGDKLSNHYKIQPFQDPKIKKDEMEEKVLTKGIEDFSKYVTKIIVIKNRFNKSHTYSPDQIKNKWKSIGGEEYPTYEKYIKWLNNKGFNTENILKELQTHTKKKIGSGEHGEVYNIGKNKIVKKSNKQNGFTPEEIKNYNLFNQYPELFPHVYKLTKDYIIMDKLDSPGKSLMDVYNFLDNINVWRDEDFMTNLYKDVQNNDLKTFNQILQKSKDLNKNEIYNTLKKCLKFCFELNKIFKNNFIDLHTNNIGVDFNGNIKIFDL
jgi:hypothetical protein